MFADLNCELTCLLQVVIVDLDKKQFVRTIGDEATLLPKKLQKALKTAINMCKIDSGELGKMTLVRNLSVKLPSKNINK